MATYWVRSSDGDNANAGTYDAPKLELLTTIGGCAPGDVIYVSDLHSYSHAVNGYYECPDIAVLSVADWGTPGSEPTPVLSAGAYEDVGGITNRFIEIRGIGDWYGCRLSGASNITRMRVMGAGATNHSLRLRRCTFDLHGAGSYLAIGLTYNDRCGTVDFDECTFDFDDATNKLQLLAGKVSLTNCVITGTVPTVLCEINYGNNTTVVKHCDFSALGSGQSIVDLAASANTTTQLFHRCRLGSDVTLVSGSPEPGAEVTFCACDHGTNYLRQYRQNYQGTVTEDTVRIRDDSDSTYSHKLVSSANTKFYSPLRSFPVARYNVVEGSPITVRVEVLTDGVTLTDGEFWIEVGYLGSASYPLGSIASSAKSDILVAASNLATSTEGWTTTDLTSPVKQYAEVTFTPQKSGLIEITACLAKASTTVYVDPDAEVS